MAYSFKILRPSMLHLLVLVLTLSKNFDQHPQLVSADYKLIETTCRAAEAPEACIQCLQSDPNAEFAGKVGIAVIVMNCIRNHASVLGDNMSQMSSSSKDQSIKDVLLGCSEEYLAAKKELLSALASLKRHKYDEAEKSVTLALYQHHSCHSMIKIHKQIIISRKISHEMKIYEQLCLAADRIIERL